METKQLGVFRSNKNIAECRKSLGRRDYRAVDKILEKIEQLKFYSINAQICCGFSRLLI